MSDIDEATRLEQLWNGEFGDQYVARNATAGGGRGPFWAWHASRFPAPRVLEIGCNVGANLRHFADLTEPNGLWGVDVNEIALTRAREALPSVNIGGGARDCRFATASRSPLSVAVLTISQRNDRRLDRDRALSRRFVTSSVPSLRSSRKNTGSSRAHSSRGHSAISSRRGTRPSVDPSSERDEGRRVRRRHG